MGVGSYPPVSQYLYDIFQCNGKRDREKEREKKIVARGAGRSLGSGGRWAGEEPGRPAPSTGPRGTCYYRHHHYIYIYLYFLFFWIFWILGYCLLFDLCMERAEEDEKEDVEDEVTTSDSETGSCFRAFCCAASFCHAIYPSPGILSVYST